jgi:hypothetical protein
MGDHRGIQRLIIIGIKAESTMKSGALVPDAMILRLILNELKTRVGQPFQAKSAQY